MILINSFLFTWIQVKYQEKIGQDVIEWKHNIGPMFISVNGSWYFISDVFNCSEAKFGHAFCNKNALDVGIASVIYLFGAFITMVVY